VSLADELKRKTVGAEQAAALVREELARQAQELRLIARGFF